MFAVGAGAEAEYPLRGHDLKDDGVLGVSPIGRSLVLLNLEWRQRLFARSGPRWRLAGFTDVAQPSGPPGDDGLPTSGMGLRLAAGGLVFRAGPGLEPVGRRAVGLFGRFWTGLLNPLYSSLMGEMWHSTTHFNS